MSCIVWLLLFFFFFKLTATTEIYTYCHTLSLHDALPIYLRLSGADPVPVRIRPDLGGRGDDHLRASADDAGGDAGAGRGAGGSARAWPDDRLHGHAEDRKSTRLNSSH